MSDVRIITGVPTAKDFALGDSPSTSPLVIDDSTNTAYYTKGTVVTQMSLPAGGVTGEVLRAVTGNPPIWSTTLWPNSIGSNEVVTQVGAANNIASRASFTFDGSTMQVAAGNPSADMTIRSENVDTSSGASRAVFLAKAAGAGGGDAVSIWTLTGGQSWAAGVDISASNNFVLCASTSLGTTNALVITTALNATFSGTLAASNLSGTNTGDQRNDQILIQDQKNSGSNGNAYSVSAWRTVVLNTTVTDTGSNVASLAANAFSLVAGSYEFEAEINAGVPASLTATGVRARLENTSDSTTVAQGCNIYRDDTLAGTGEDDMLVAVRGSFVIASQKTFELQVYPAYGATTAPTNLGTGDKEIYASIWLRRYA